MSRRPVSTPVRALAVACYLFPVAIGLLAIPAYRQIRLIRIRAIVSLLMIGALTALVALLGRITIYELSMVVGLLLTVAIAAYFGLSAWSAFAAYQGREPTVPGLTAVARRLEKRLWQRRPAREAEQVVRPAPRTRVDDSL